MDAHTVDSAFTAEGLLYQTLMRIQFNLLKTPSWRGGEEDHSPVSKIITL
jgi:hypothetical protein